MSSNCIIGGIIKHSNGIGFKLTFKDHKTANQYKDMINWIILNDGIKTKIMKGRYDDKF